MYKTANAHSDIRMNKLEQGAARHLGSEVTTRHLRLPGEVLLFNLHHARADGCCWSVLDVAAGIDMCMDMCGHLR